MNNTFRVAVQVPRYTFGAVTRVTALQHNLCMANVKKGGPDPVATLSGARIRKAREARHWSQKDLAEQTGWVSHKPSRAQRMSLAPSRIANFEQGTRRVGLEEARILTTALGEFPAPYWMGVISEQEAAVLAALRRSEPPPHPPQATDQPSSPSPQNR
jgi:transcriptional regulator with XRE-family HTH domain